MRGQLLPGSWSAGRTSHNSPAALSARFSHQEIHHDAAGCHICTHLDSPLGFRAIHTVRWRTGARGFLIESAMVNTGAEPLEVEMLSSFSLAGLTPFAPDDAPGRMFLHRFLSAWSNEGRHTAESLEELHLERNWGAQPVVVTFGQAGSMPLRGYHPFVAIEDRTAGVVWGAQLALHRSWQMEVFRRDDSVAISGGLGDFDHAHWMKRLDPGESLAGPSALVACVRGGIEELCHAHLDLLDEMSAPSIGKFFR